MGSPDNLRKDVEEEIKKNCKIYEDTSGEKLLSDWNLRTDPDYPYDSLMKKQLYKQLTKQFKFDPKNWKMRSDTGEGHWMKVRDPEGIVDSFSGYLINIKTGNEVFFWIDWTSPCDKDRKFHEPTVIHNSPDECQIRFYFLNLGDKRYLPDGKLDKKWNYISRIQKENPKLSFKEALAEFEKSNK